ncbi:MAG: SDR family oxidoreductase [Deltaproteobacteria bacterium]|nr:SDR family oxidoreductase [Deltaproteobacteria bacterium]MBW2386966.1 SDR family oxidoreductase [Deltaproteobacteria bacterium]MBW2723677.1 SDR family oxidoreductase [Deltaproteobacteria bacterium]
MNTQISSRVAIVTGASSGIGEATARRLARAGFRVVAAARRLDRLEAIAKELDGEGLEVLPVATDLAEDESTHALVEQTLAAWGRIDVLVNNAGYSPAAATEQLSRADLRHTFDVNLLSQLQLVAEVTPVMREQGGGRIINVGSMAGSVAAPLAVPYSATKAGIEAASHCLRLELAPWKIEVSLIIPGFVATEAFDSARILGQARREDLENPYRQLMFDLEDFTNDQLRGALSPDDVAITIERAATARRARARYFAPRHGRLQRGLLGLIPDRMRDRLLLRMYTGGSKRDPPALTESWWPSPAARARRQSDRSSA